MIIPSLFDVIKNHPVSMSEESIGEIELKEKWTSGIVSESIK
jgi:hypothetical protein